MKRRNQRRNHFVNVVAVIVEKKLIFNFQWINKAPEFISLHELSDDRVDECVHVVCLNGGAIDEWREHVEVA